MGDGGTLRAPREQVAADCIADQRTRRRLRIVVFTPGHSEVGGVARRSRLLCEELARRGNDVRVVTRSGTSASFAFRRTDNLRVVEVPRLGGRRRGAAGFLLVAVVLGTWWSRRADALLSVQLVSPTTAAAVVGRLRRLPFVAMSTTSGDLTESQYLVGASAPARLRRSLVGGAATLVAQTEMGAGELVSVVPADRVAVLPTPVESVEELPLSGRPSVLFTGRFSEEKALPSLLEAWTAVVDRIPHARLVLAGAGGEYRSVESEVRAIVAADEHLARTVHLPGWVTDVHGLLSEHDVYVFPSLSEGMSNSLVEACAAGRAVVASDIPPNVAVLGPDYPLLFPAGDAGALAATLLRALTDDDARASAAASAAARARGMLLPDVAADLEELLRCAADRTRPQRA